ncbi:hypothetical protein [Escherichia fergusonii]|uniref:hypothetical protein n=1 Tax=Escherichia fergusonii TaxID=564 RepID=UPI0022306E9D|nr:hypothetical protein [Escherichia fergusonii]
MEQPEHSLSDICLRHSGITHFHRDTSAIGKESYVTLDGMGGKIGSDLIFDRNVHVATTLSGQNNSFHP